MPEPTPSSSEAAQIVALIEANPLEPCAWEKLAEKANRQNDSLSIKSIEIIIEGLKEMQAGEAKARPKLSVLSQSMFVRLAKAYNSPALHKEVGLIYLRDLGLPNASLRHFERSARLGGHEEELRPLTEAAAVAVQRQLARRSGQEPAHSGITTAQHAKPVAPNIIRKTGKILLSSHFTQSSATESAADVLEKESKEAGPPPSSTAECLEQARQAIGKGEFKRAKILLQKANEKPVEKPEMWQHWTNLGQACYEAGLHQLAEEAFLEALNYDSKALASHFNVALGYHLNKKYDFALASYLRANQIEPRHPKVWCNLGVLYFQMDDYAKAEVALRYATLADPEYARAWDNLAAAMGAQDKMEDAMEACGHAVTLRPDYPEAYFKLGVAYFSKNNLPMAAEHFRRAALLPAISAYCDAFLAMIYARLEQADAAEAAVLRAVKSDPKCDVLWMAWNDLGMAWYSAGDYHKSAVAYGEATMLKPDEPEAWFNLGVSYQQIGDMKAAQDSYQQAVDLDESFAAAWHNLGIVCAQNNDHGSAMFAFRQEVHWEPDNIRAWFDLGVSLDKLERPDEARVAYATVDQLSKAAAKSSIGGEYAKVFSIDAGRK